MMKDPNSVAKKMVIKPFKSNPTLPSDFEETAWRKLETAINAVCSKTSIDMSKEELYRVSILFIFIYSSHISSS